jgi:hypothetical protein
LGVPVHVSAHVEASGTQSIAISPPKQFWSVEICTYAVLIGVGGGLGGNGGGAAKKRYQSVAFMGEPLQTMLNGCSVQRLSASVYATWSNV